MSLKSIKVFVGRIRNTMYKNFSLFKSFCCVFIECSYFCMHRILLKIYFRIISSKYFVSYLFSFFFSSQSIYACFVIFVFLDCFPPLPLKPKRPVSGSNIHPLKILKNNTSVMSSNEALWNSEMFLSAYLYGWRRNDFYLFLRFF